MADKDDESQCVTKEKCWWNLYSMHASVIVNKWRIMGCVHIFISCLTENEEQDRDECI